MEINLLTVENSRGDHRHHHHQQQQQQREKGSGSDDSGDMISVRSYSCNFCKRGFTNAQALGGHMNIHRKDRAKLISSQFVPDQYYDDQNYQPSLDHKRPVQERSREEDQNFLVKRTDHDLVAEKGEEKASSCMDKSDAEKKELDLELRLGPDPKSN